MIPRRLPGAGWLALVGGGEFTFEETLDADAAWLEKALPGPVGFLPAASGSVDYGRHFTAYMEEVFERRVVTLPIYRARDGRRGKNLERIEQCAAVYLGGGVADHLLDAVADGPAAEALVAKLASGGVVVAIAAAAQALGVAARSIRPGETIPGLGWLPGGVVEPNFDAGELVEGSPAVARASSGRPFARRGDAGIAEPMSRSRNAARGDSGAPGVGRGSLHKLRSHDRRLRRLLQAPGATWGLGLAAGTCLLLGPDRAVERVGEAWTLEDPEGELEALGEE